MSRSTKLAYLLRHDEKTYDFPHTGWRTIDDLCVNHGYTFDEILNIVRNDRMGRFEFNDERTLIRAVYGHSVDVWIGSEPGKQLNAVMCTVDLVKNDAELKLLIGCTQKEKAYINSFYNDWLQIGGILIESDDSKIL